MATKRTNIPDPIPKPRPFQPNPIPTPPPSNPVNPTTPVQSPPSNPPPSTQDDNRPPPGESQASPSPGLTNQQQLEKVAQFASQELFKQKTSFPFDILPRILVVDLNKITIINDLPLSLRGVHSFLIEDISDVVINHFILFSNLVIIDKNFKETPIKLPFRKYDDALRAKKIIQGLLVAKKMGVDYSGFDTIDGLSQKLLELGEAPGVS